jgi:hypothetical protein
MTGWGEVLDELERHVEAAERIAVESAGAASTAGTTPSGHPWEAPVGLGPLPHELRARAELLLDRQRRALDRVAPLLEGTRERLQGVRRVGPGSSRPGTAVYVDVTA